jgi:NTE family protein
MSGPQKIAYVLAGGGSLGAVQVGMLKALVRANVMPDMVVGASVGAINGTYFAAEPSAEGLARLERVWGKLRRSDIFPISLIDSMLAILGRRDHFVTPSALRSLVESELPCERLEHASIPCHVVTTDVLDGSEVVITSGPTCHVLLASAAIPAVFPPVPIDGRHLMDGAVANHTPISTAIKLGATRIIVLPTGLSCALDRPPRKAMACALHAVNLLVMRQLLSDIDRFSSLAELVVVPPLCPVTVNAYDFSQTADLIRRAEASTRLWLKKKGLEKEGAPEELMPHGHEGEGHHDHEEHRLPA